MYGIFSQTEAYLTLFSRLIINRAKNRFELGGRSPDAQKVCAVAKGDAVLNYILKVYLT